MRGGSQDSFFQERLAIRVQQPTLTWYVMPVIAALLLAGAVAVRILMKGSWSAVASATLTPMMMIAAGVIVLLVLGSLTGARRRARNLLGTNLIMILVAIAIIVIAPGIPQQNLAQLWFQGPAGKSINKRIVTKGEDVGGKDTVTYALRSYYGVLGHSVEAADVTAIGFVWRDPAMTGEFQMPSAPTSSTGEVGAEQHTFDPAKSFRITRLYAWETVGDAAAISIDGQCSDTTMLSKANGKWAKIDGTVASAIYDQKTLPVLWAGTVSPARPPADALIWAGGK